MSSGMTFGFFMKCPYCTSEESKVTDSRDIADSVRRRRECLACGQRFTTYERVENVNLLIIKKDGRREEFDRRKLATGVRKACEKRPLPVGAVEGLVDEVENELHKLGKAEVASSVVGEMVMERLRKLDHVAYIRFASVYRAFADVEAFRHELEVLTQSVRPARSLGGQLPLLAEDDAGSRPKAKRFRQSE